jgi:hypothetical protein
MGASSGWNLVSRPALRKKGSPSDIRAASSAIAEPNGVRATYRQRPPVPRAKRRHRAI